MIHGVSPISLPIIYNCGTPSKVLSTLNEDILKYYDNKPIIVVHSKEQENEITKMIEKSKLKFFKDVDNQTLQEIRTLEYGILLMLV